MSKFGTILTLGLAGIGLAAGYTLYRNSDKVGSAISRVFEKTLSTSFSNTIDNLWQNTPTPTPTSNEVETNKKYQKQLNQKLSDQKKSGTSSMDEYEYVTNSNDNPFKFNPKNNPKYGPSNPYGTPKSPPKEGWYYINYKGSKYDKHQYLSSKLAQSYQKLSGSGALQNIHYTGVKLGPAGLKLFAQSRNYI